jgi:hypothetical protein
VSVAIIVFTLGAADDETLTPPDVPPRIPPLLELIPDDELAVVLADAIRDGKSGAMTARGPSVSRESVRRLAGRTDGASGFGADAPCGVQMPEPHSTVPTPRYAAPGLHRLASPAHVQPVPTCVCARLPRPGPNAGQQHSVVAVRLQDAVSGLRRRAGARQDAARAR